MGEGGAPDRFLVSLAVLNLLSDVAEDRPVVCVIDDVQWLDQASVHALAFVARRLLAESVALVFATRSDVADHPLRDMPELHLTGLAVADSRVLLRSALRGPLEAAVVDGIVAEARGNPLALLELPAGALPPSWPSATGRRAPHRWRAAWSRAFSGSSSRYHQRPGGSCSPPPWNRSGT